MSEEQEQKYEKELWIGVYMQRLSQNVNLKGISTSAHDEECIASANAALAAFREAF